MTRPNARRVRLVARTELRRTWRNLRDSTRGVVMLLGGGLMIPLYSLGIGASHTSARVRSQKPTYSSYARPH
ncbi:hypothetical protein [Haloarcula amylovorans]|uniref:hypothetical protein n=1 Tax=Haloarcula amylovorans TaxID=2562280 RepID=UPI001FD81595|nr:hypothetical protein [Halomicroarcula amylolytica]